MGADDHRGRTRWSSAFAPAVAGSLSVPSGSSSVASGSSSVLSGSSPVLSGSSSVLSGSSSVLSGSSSVLSAPSVSSAGAGRSLSRPNLHQEPTPKNNATINAMITQMTTATSTQDPAGGEPGRKLRIGMVANSIAAIQDRNAGSNLRRPR